MTPRRYALGFLVVLTALVASAVVALAGATRSGAQAVPSSSSFSADSSVARSLLLVTWDTTRADRIGCYGSKGARTPSLDALAGNGLLYERAYSSSPITLPSHTTILTGAYPCAHGVRDNAIFAVDGAARLLPEVLHDAGFRTAAFVGSFILDAKFGLNQGFDVYDAPDPSAVGLGFSVIDRPASAVSEKALAFVDQLKPGERFFLWVHFYDPHSPHAPPPGFARPGESDYDAEIAFCDQETRRILDRLRGRGLADGLITVVTADHGESNGEHGEETHGNFVYDATMRVPLVVAPPPAGVAPGTRVGAAVSTADVAATLLERLGLGRELLPDAKCPTLPTIAAAVAPAAGDDERALYLEAFMPFHSHRWHPLRAVVWKGFKYVESPRPELYELASDAGELHDLARARPEVATRLAARLQALAAENPPLGWATQGSISIDDQQKLQQIGYLAAATGGDPTDPTLPDVKDRIGDLRLLDEIGTLLRDSYDALGIGVTLRTGRAPELTPEQRARGEALLQQAKERSAAIRAANPADPFLDQIDSTIAINLGDYAAAVAPLERAVVAAPRNMPVRYNLAVAYSRTGKPEWAQREMEKALFVEPRSLAGHRWIVVFSGARKDWAAAAHWVKEWAKCPGQTNADLDAVENARKRIELELAKIGGAPRPPAPVTEADLVPEGLRAKVPESR